MNHLSLTPLKLLLSSLKNGTALIVVLVLLALLAPWIEPFPYDLQNVDESLKPASLSHWFGTDSLGRDLFSRVLRGLQMSICIGFVSAFMSMTLGACVGVVSGWFGGTLDRVILQLLDTIQTLPSLLIAILLTVYVGKGTLGILLAIAFSSWVPLARVARYQTLLESTRPYVESASCLGASDTRILFNHVIPGCIGTWLVTLSYTIPSAILSESFLAFLGLGIQPPYSSLGSLAAEGFRSMRYYPHLTLFPAASLFLVLMGFYYFSEHIKSIQQSSLSQQKLSHFES